ncbi:hypothetical protein E1281_02505 [Actinomadura sp. KC345]|uniref:hypothetical protein n=1 Tax=Actinomadura sp. KC345 TaxID=2530371 RepID=UPI00104F9928|nr:hypothetical protein [Actinomadura sp. KC345]TDC58073.1 hypothetical protein E1281_02505 [Actinomadura sp. KC345]
MQLPRVVIAAVFFVIGALIAVPAIFDGAGGESSASTGATTSGSPDPSGSPSPSGTATSPSPSPSKTPAQAVTASIESVSCPASTVNVTIRNTGQRNEDFAVEKNDDTAAIPGEIQANSTRTVAVELREDRSTRITVNWANKRIESKTVKANCEKAGAAPTKTPPEELPNTGPDAVLWARGATGVAIILTGAIIFWYGGIWPRRRDPMLPKNTD